MSRRNLIPLYSAKFEAPARLRSVLCSGAVLCPCGTPAASEELQKIVPKTDQIPLGGYLANPAQQELPEFAHMLDLPKDGFHNSLAFAIQVPPLDCLELSSPTVLDGRPKRKSPSKRWNDLARVFGPTGRNVAVDSLGA